MIMTWASYTRFLVGCSLLLCTFQGVTAWGLDEEGFLALFVPLLKQDPRVKDADAEAAEMWKVYEPIKSLPEGKQRLFEAMKATAAKLKLRGASQGVFHKLFRGSGGSSGSNMNSTCDKQAFSHNGRKKIWEDLPVPEPLRRRLASPIH